MPQQSLDARLLICKTKNVVCVRPINPVPHVPFEHGPQYQGQLLIRRRILEQQAPPQGVVPDHVREDPHEHVGLLLVLLELEHHVAGQTFLEPGNRRGLQLAFKTLDVKLGHVNARPAAVVFGPRCQIARRRTGGLELGGKIA